MATTCPQCGSSVADGVTFCPSCGEMLPDPAASAPPPPPQRPAPTPSRPQAPTAGSPGVGSPGAGSPGAGPASGTPSSQAPRRPRVIRVPQRPRAQQQAPTFPGFPSPRQPTPPMNPRSGQPIPPWGYPQQQRRSGCGGCLGRTLLLLLLVPLALYVLPTIVAMVTQGGTSTAPATTAPRTSVTSWSTSSAASSATSVSSSASGSSASNGSASGSVAGSASATPSRAQSTSAGRIIIVGTACPSTATGAYSGIAVGTARTSCTFAAATRTAYVESGADGENVTLDVYSQARKANVRLTCSGDAPVECRSADGAVVYLYTGEAIVTG